MKILPEPVKFEWDIGNQDKNWHKHKVDAKEAEEVFFNKPFKIYPDKTHSLQEQRFLALGQTNKRRLLTLIFTIRDKQIRIISARDQSKKDRRVYEKSN